MFGLFSLPPDISGDVLSSVYGLTSDPRVQQQITRIGTLARNAVELLMASPVVAHSPFIPSSITPRTPKSRECYQIFKTRTETPIAESDILSLLQSKPSLSIAIKITDYLNIISEFKTTAKIYTKLLAQWGYTQFYRVFEPDLKGIATAFIMHVLLEDSPHEPSLLHDRLVAYFNTILKNNTYPDLKADLTTSLDYMITGSKELNKITSSGPCLFINTLNSILVLDFYQKTGSKEWHFEEFLASLANSKELLDTLSSLDEAPSALLVPLLGSKQSIFGVNALQKFQLFKDNLSPILSKVKQELLKRLEDSPFKTHLTDLDPIKLLIVFDQDPLGIPFKETLKPLMLRLFKQQIQIFLTECQSIFIEGYNFAERAAPGNLCGRITDELMLISGAYLFKIYTMDLSALSKLAEAVENFEEVLIQRQLDFARYLANVFSINFNIHSWQISTEEKKRLKLHHIGHWHGPTCHLVLFPEQNKSRVDLLKPHGIYTARTDLNDMAQAPNFKLFKRHGSTTLASIAENTSSPSHDKVLAKQLLYFRLHIFSCLQKLFDYKLPLLSDDTRYDAYGNKEDDAAEYNPFGLENTHSSNSDIEDQTFRFEKHLSGLNTEIAELTYIADSVFSHTRHEEIIFEITKHLHAAKKTILQFYISKIPALLTNFQAIIRACQTEALNIFTNLKLQSAAYAAVNKDKLSLFETFISQADIANISSSAIIPLVPRLKIEKDPPSIFNEIDKLKRMIDSYQEARKIDLLSLETDLRANFQNLKTSQYIVSFTAFFPTYKDLFRQLIAIENPLMIPDDLISKLKPEHTLGHVGVEQTINLLNYISEKIKKYKITVELQSEDNQKAIQALKETLLTHRASFVALNPANASLFDTLLNSEDILSINSKSLLLLKTIPESVDDHSLIYRQLTLLYKLLIKIRNYSKESHKLEERQAFFSSNSDQDFLDVSLDNDQVFPDNGSLGSCDDTESLGGASYSSEFPRHTIGPIKGSLKSSDLDTWLSSIS